MKVRTVYQYHWIFSVPSENTSASVSTSNSHEYLSRNSLTDIPYRFRIYSSNNYLDPSNFRIYVYLLSKMRIRKRNMQVLGLVEIQIVGNIE